MYQNKRTGNKDMKQVKKPLKTGGVFFTDANLNIVKFTKKQAETQIKRFRRDAERKLTNNFKYKHLELVEKGDYFTYSMA
ncbi:hypothetical protein VPHK460_0126 [Vibrio phage K460]